VRSSGTDEWRTTETKAQSAILGIERTAAGRKHAFEGVGGLSTELEARGKIIIMKWERSKIKG
jgi:hypothetical protein